MEPVAAAVGKSYRPAAIGAISSRSGATSPTVQGGARLVDQGEEPCEPGRGAHPRRDVVRMSAIGDGMPRQRARFDRQRNLLAGQEHGRTFHYRKSSGRFCCDALPLSFKYCGRV
jgi:hypothetical protein